MMLVKSLKVLAQQDQATQCAIEIRSRLPYYIHGPCILNCVVKVQRESQYYHLVLHSTGKLTINCQRCLQDFIYAYEHQSEIAICFNEEGAKRMMARLDCMVHPEDSIDLSEIVTDDLHLFSPEKHEDCTLSRMKDLESE